jgi:hypothetical protein
MNISNICFLIPVHPPHFHIIYSLLNKLKINNIKIDVFLIFSCNFDYDIFKMKDCIFPIIVYEEINMNSIVTFKKCYGLQKMIEYDYDYIICFDSEIDIIAENFTNDNLTEKINNIYENKIVYAGDTNNNHNVVEISRTSANVFSAEDYNKLSKLTNNFNLYCFWSDLPVYRKNDLSDFFKTINYNNIKYNLVWHQFEHIIYQYYLMLKDNFKIINITPVINIQWSLENFIINDVVKLNYLAEIGYGFSWVSKNSFIHQKDYLLNKKVCFIYHLDR